ncbi:MAG: class I SAM-dependent methyltransferase [Gammaproteobacteria bacterium]|nr:class I SAM-dependent methyltransferase [Gammaproteobacteria bacterium]
MSFKNPLKLLKSYGLHSKKDYPGDQSQQTSNQIIKELMENKSHYNAMAKQEGKIWGNVFTDNERNLAIKSDQRAAKALRLNRNKFTLIQALQKYALKPNNGLSLACGNGRAERGLMQAGICQSFHAIDISSDALEEARQLAKDQSLKSPMNKLILMN